MRKANQPSLWLLLLGSVILMTALLWPESASAQCGSSASSCKNCHEVQGEDPVNSDGTSWHEAHAFGDFCEFCHAGNVQATDKEGAHTGMEAPLANIQASCGNCHAADLHDRAEVYATALGVEIGSSGGSSGGEPSPVDNSDAAVVDTNENANPSVVQISLPAAPTGLVIDDPNVIDYVARYNEVVLGIHPVNRGNITLGVLIAMVAVGGGAFVIYNERVLAHGLGETRSLVAEYPADVVEILPAIVSLKPRTRRSLEHLLRDTNKATKALDLIETLSENHE